VKQHDEDFWNIGVRNYEWSITYILGKEQYIPKAQGEAEAVNFF
jgi:hypothetical protein